MDYKITKTSLDKSTDLLYNIKRSDDYTINYGGYSSVG